MAPAGQSSGIVMAVALVAAMAWEILHAMAKAKKKNAFYSYHPEVPQANVCFAVYHAGIYKKRITLKSCLKSNLIYIPEFTTWFSLMLDV